MIPILQMDAPGEAQRVEALLAALRLNPAELALARGGRSEAEASVRHIMAEVADRGDAALVESARRFDDPAFTADQLRVSASEMRGAAQRTPASLMDALRRSIAQVRQYQLHVMPREPELLVRPGVELGMRLVPLQSAGLYFPGGKAAYPSSLVMLAVPAQVAGVKRIVVCTPPSKYGRMDLVLAACHELGLEEVYRVGGAAAVAAMAFGTQAIRPVDKIVGPGNTYVQLAKRLVAGCVGIDAFLGPSEIVVIADDTGRAEYIAADLIAQAEHDPGSCFLITTSAKLAESVAHEIGQQLPQRQRRRAIEKALRECSAIIVVSSMRQAVELANRFAAEHMNIQTRDPDAVLAGLSNAGAVFIGPYSPVAAGDYVAGPSHCLPTNTTARFSSGISVYEFLKRSSVVRYDAQGLAADAAAIEALAEAEHLDGHAASVRVRMGD